MFNTNVSSKLGANIGVKHNGELSLFRNQILNPIVYLYDPIINQDYYVNRPNSGSYGWGIRYYFKNKNTFLKISGSRYHVIEQSNLPETEMMTSKNAYLAMPNYRFSLQCSQTILPSLTVHFSSVYQSEFYQRSYQLEEAINNGPLLNVGIQKSFLQDDNLKLTVGMNNILNSEYAIGVATDSEINPMPLFYRQFNISLLYKL